LSVAKELREYTERSNAIHKEYLSDPALLENYTRFVAWQTDYMLPFYEDLRASKDYSAAVDFVVSDLTGIGVSQRDHDIARVVPIMSKMLPEKALRTMAAAMRLNARVLEINLSICRILYSENSGVREFSEADYCAASRQAGSLDECLELIHLTAEVGHSLDHVVRIPMIGAMLRAMRMPARLWGFAAMQKFLEKGYTTFDALEDVDRFLDVISNRMAEVFTRIFTEPIERLNDAPLSQ
jgi:hypothetical protein